MIHNKRRLAAAIAAMSAILLTPSVVLAQRPSAPVMGSVPVAHVAPATGRSPAGTHIAANATTGTRTNASPSTTARVNTYRGRSFTTSNATATATNTHQHSADAFGNSGFGGFPLSIQDLLNITPSNGFDWQYVNSINQDLPIKAFIDPVTQIEVAQAERLLRSTGGVVSGAYLLGGGGYYMPPEEEGAPPAEEQGQAPAQSSQAAQPQIIVLQQAPAPQTQAAPQREPSDQEELPDRGPFTLVLRSGKQVQAVAFTHAQGKIVYITPEGGRFTISAGDLDPDATMRVNEERGTPLQLKM